MQAANEGAARVQPAKDGRSVGIRVDLPFEQGVNPIVSDAYDHRTFFSRLHHFALVSDAFVVVPGGIGTVLETMLVWQLLQVRKLTAVPLIPVGPMWNGLIDWHREVMLREAFELTSPMDLEIPQCVPDAAGALTILRQAQADWRRARRG
jgi:predicted Rossmann-fold nucleotide-binding protein